jgi:SAM-dependent methyltransferase
LAQQLIMDFVGELARTIELPDPIVEFGSLQVESGQPNDLRPAFPGRDFVGTDIRSGPGVDRVEDLRSLSFGDDEIGTALCLDTLEHCEDPLAATREMHRALRPGGVCVISSVMLFGIHAYPNDYWRFTPEGFRVLLAPFDDAWVTGIGAPDIPIQVIGVAAKGCKLDLSLERFPALEAAQSRWDRAPGRIRFGVVHLPPRAVVEALRREVPRLVKERVVARLSRTS